MSRVSFKPGNMLYPVPAVIVSCRGIDGRDNCLTVAWAGTVCSDPAMVSISVRKERFSHKLIKESGEFVINLTTEDMVKATDFCGVKSGRDLDKFEKTGLKKMESMVVKAPSIEQSPVCIECKVTEIKELGSHDMFIAEVVHVSVDDSLLDEKNSFHLDKAGLMTYSHGRYFALGKKLGKFGFSVEKKKAKKKRSYKNKK